MLDHALAYAAAGHKIFPLFWPTTTGEISACGCGDAACRSIAKHPIASLVPRGCLDATNDLEIVRAWWSRAPSANIGLALDGLLVLDVDPRNGGGDSYLRLVAEHPLPPTFTVSTGGGGEHYYFRTEPGKAYGGFDRRTLPGLDVKKAAGGYVVAPPSVHASGGRYSVRLNAPIVQLPEVLDVLLRSAADVAAPGLVLCEPMPANVAQERVPQLVTALAPHYVEGCKHDIAFALGGFLNKKGWSQDSIREVVGQLPSRDSAARVRDALSGTRKGDAGPGAMQLKRLLPDEVLAELERLTENPADAARLRAFEEVCRTSALGSAPRPRADSWIKNGAHCFEERPEIQFLVPELGIAPGPPTMVVALGYVGKSLFMLSLLLSVASGQPVWSMFGVPRKGRSIFLDYEGPDVLLQDRLQRLAVGMGLGPEIAGMIDHGRPPTYLDGQRDAVRAWLVETLGGYAAAVIDSYRVACPTIDENDSRAAIPLDLLAEASELTGCVVFVIHHASKGSKDEDDAVNPRGSTALFNACGTVLTISSKDPEGPKRVQHTKAKFARRPQPAFMVRIEDLPISCGVEPVRVVGLNKAEHEARELSQNEQRILRTLREQGPFQTISANSVKKDSAPGQLMAACKMGSSAFEPAFQSLKQRSFTNPGSEGLCDTGKGLARTISYVPPAGATNRHGFALPS
jgi:hypothetical protein